MSYLSPEKRSFTQQQGKAANLRKESDLEKTKKNTLIMIMMNIMMKIRTMKRVDFAGRDLRNLKTEEDSRKRNGIEMQH